MRGGAAHDVILIDDMRVYNSPDNPRWNPSEVPDYYRIDHISIADLTGPFLATHDVRMMHEQEGILTLIPKGSGHGI